jgi:hypothetical protein
MDISVEKEPAVEDIKRIFLKNNSRQLQRWQLPLTTALNVC